MKKQILGIFLVMLSFVSKAQFDYSPTGRNDVPVLGMQWGLVGGGFTAMLNNRDDIEADGRLDPQMMNFSYAAGIEGIYWFQRTIGFGWQAMYWKGGAAYTGKDTINKFNLSAKADLTYIKLPLLFHFKSYNRYYPDRRTRFSAMFGPYVALLSSYDDAATLTYYEYDPVIKSIVDLSAETVTATATNGEIVKGKLTGQVYNPLDIGFVVGFGGEVRLWRRTTIALHIRTDIGISNVENLKGLKITYDNDITKDYDYKQWSGKYAKYTAPNSLDQLTGWVDNRPATKNFSVGAFLSIRKYLSN